MDKLREIFDKNAGKFRDDGLWVDALDLDGFEQAIADYEASKWVSVDERLPEVGDEGWVKVLAVVKDTVEHKYGNEYIMIFCNGSFHYGMKRGPIRVCTHWQYITPPTK